MGIDTLYGFFVSALAAGVLLASFNLYVTQSQNEAFFNLYFENPKLLPKELPVGTDINFSVSVSTSNDWNGEFPFQGMVRYYKLFDITEGTYNCLGKYRNKIFLHWENRSVTSEPIDRLRTVYTAEKPANDLLWDQYHLEFGIQRLAGSGQLTIFFGQNEVPHYRVTIDYQHAQILFNGDVVPFDNTFTSKSGQTRPLIDFYGTKNLEAHLFVINNTITFYLDKQLIFSEKYARTQRGRFWFESQNMYANVVKTKIYRDTPVTVPDRGEVLDVNIAPDAVLEGSRRVRETLATSVDMLGEFYSDFFTLPADDVLYYALDCESPLCIQFSTDGSAAGPSHPHYFFYRVAFENYAGARSFVYTPRDPSALDNRMPWTQYTLEYTASPLLGARRSTLVMDNHYAVELDVARNGVRVLIANGNNITEDFEPVSINMSAISAQNVVLIAANGTLRIIVNSEELPRLWNVPDPSGTPIIIFRDGRGTLDSLIFDNLEPRCSDLSQVLACRKSYRVRDAPVRGTPIRSTSITPTVAPVAEEELTVDHMTAPSKVLAFGGQDASLNNVTDYFFSFKYAALDGQKRVQLLFESINGSQYSLEIDEREGRISFTPLQNPSSAQVERYTQERAFPDPLWHTVRLDYVNGTVAFLLDDQFIYSFSNLDLDTGIFTLRLDETFGHFENVYIRNRASGGRRDFPISDDPCRLREVGREVLESGVWNMSGDAIQTRSYKTKLGYNVDETFDYAYIQYLAGEQDIHFWVVPK